MSWSRESRFRSPTRLEGRIDCPSPQSVPAVWMPVKVQTSPHRMPSPTPNNSTIPPPIPVPVLVPSPVPVEAVALPMMPSTPTRKSCGNCEGLQAQLDDALDQVEILRKDVVNAQAKLILQKRPVDESMLEHYKSEASRAQGHLQQREVEWSEEWASKQDSLKEKHSQDIHKLTIELEDAETRIEQLQAKNKQLEETISNTVVASPTTPRGDSELFALQTRCEEAERQIEALTTEKEELNRTAMLLRTNLQKSEYSLREYTEGIDRDDGVTVSLREQIDSLQGNLEDEEAAVASLKNEVNTLQLALDTAKKGSSVASEKLQSQLQELSDEVRRLEAELEEATDEAARAERSKNMHDSEKSHFEASFATLRKKLEAAVDAESEVRDANQKLLGDLEQANDELERAKSELKLIEGLREREKSAHEDSVAQAASRARGGAEHEAAVLKEALEGMNRMLEESKSEVAEMKTRYDNTVEQLKAGSAVERARLQEKLAAAKAVADEETLTASRLESDVSRLTLELQGAQEELSRLTTLYGRSLETVETERTRHKAAVKELNAQLDSECTKREDTVHELKTQLSGMGEELEAKSNELRLAQVKVSGRMDEADTATAEYRRQLQQAANKAQVHELEIQQQTKKNSEMEGELVRLREESLTYTSSLDLLTKERNAAVTSCTAFEQDVTSLREQLDTHTVAKGDELSALRATNSKLTIELDSATRQLNILKEETDKRVAQLKGRITEADTSNSDQAQEIIQLKCTVEMLEMEKSRLDNQMKKKVMESEAMESRVARLKEAASRAADLEDTFDVLKAEKEKLHSEMENMTIDLEESRRGFKRMKGKLDVEQQQHEELRAKTEGHKKELSDARSDLLNLQDVCERQKKTIAELQHKEDEVLLKHSSSMADLKRAGSVMQDQSSEIEDLQTRLTRAQDNEQAVLAKLQELAAAHEEVTNSHTTLKEEGAAQMASKVEGIKQELEEKDKETQEKILLLKQKETTLLKLEEEIAKQKEEIEFIVFTRSELVQAIMDLRKTVREAGKEHNRYFAKDPTYRRAQAQAGSTNVFKIGSTYMADAVRAVKRHLDLSLERVNGIAGRYLTDYEKMHHGSSPQHFDEKHSESCNMFDMIMKKRVGSASPPRGRSASPRKAAPAAPLVLQHPKEVAMVTPRRKSEVQVEDEAADKVPVLPSDLNADDGVRGVLSAKELGARVQNAASTISQRKPAPKQTRAMSRSHTTIPAPTMHNRSATPKGKGTSTRSGGGGGSATGGLKFIDASTRNHPKRKGFL